MQDVISSSVPGLVHPLVVLLTVDVWRSCDLMKFVA